jgi:hypothetical protein
MVDMWIRPANIPGQVPPEAAARLQGSRVLVLVVQIEHAGFIIAATRLIWN